MDDGIPLCSFLLNIEFYSWSEIFNPIGFSFFVGIFFILIFLILTGIVSSAEVALFSLDYRQLKQMEKSGDEMDKKIVAFIEKPKKLLATILLCVTLFSLSIVLIFEYIIEISIKHDFLIKHPVTEFVIKVSFETFIIVLFAEVIPKIYASQNNHKVARLLIKPLQFFNKLFSPAVNALIAASSFFEKRLDPKGNNVTAQDISDAIDITSAKSKESSKERTKILKGIVKFGNINVSQIMRSRIDMVAVDHDASFHDLLTIVRESGYSRIPVYENDMDKITGIIYIKDLLKYLNEKNDFDWKKLMRPPLFVPENKKIDDLLEDFQERHIHIAIVVDEYGSCCGLVTLEDVLEEVIGDIKDEFDDASEIDFKKLDNNNYIFEAKTALNDVCKVMDLPTETFDEVRGTADSLAGMLLELNNEIPKEGDEIKYGKFTFLILEASMTRIIRVKISIT